MDDSRWVVELFGFDPELPLAKDMEARGVKAIVMEVRFSQVSLPCWAFL